MSTSTPSRGSSLGRRVLAAAVLLVAGIILFKIFVGLISTLAVVAVAVLAIAAVIWAIRVL